MHIILVVKHYVILQ